MTIAADGTDSLDNAEKEIHEASEQLHGMLFIQFFEISFHSQITEYSNDNKN